MSLNRFLVNFLGTFGRPGILLNVEPKMERKDKDNPKSEQVQAHDDEGTPKWIVTIAVPVQGFDREKFENLSITVVSKVQPLTNAAPGQLVIADNLEVGIMKQEKTGYTTFFSAAAVKPVTLQAPPQAPAQQR